MAKSRYCGHHTPHSPHEWGYSGGWRTYLCDGGAAVIAITGSGVGPDTLESQALPPSGSAGGSRPGGLGKLMRQVWDAGYIAGHSHAMRQMSDEPHAPKPINPYE